MADPVVLYAVDDKISIITLNRADKLNAISAAIRPYSIAVAPSSRLMSLVNVANMCPPG